MKKAFILGSLALVSLSDLPLFAQSERANIQSAESELNPFIKFWQERNQPVILVKKMDTILNTPEFVREGFADEPTKLMVGIVEVSTTEAVTPGTLVLLELLTQGQPGSGADESPYWLANISENNPPVLLNEKGTAIYLFGEFTYVWNGNALKNAPDSLHGVWKQMVDLVKK